jgi:chemotaxis methyl-accepting protein methylase
MQRRALATPAFDDHWTLSDQEFLYFSELISNIAGISLSLGKKTLVRSRLRSSVESLGLSSFQDYKKFLQTLPANDPHWQEFINLLTTNKTDFFREPKHFEFIVNSFLPQWLLKGEPTLKVWSCASSSGEEPYTLAMVLKKYLPKDRDFKILATDIDTEILERARNGVYSVAKLPEIPREYQKESISLGTGSVRDWFRIKSELKDKIVFSQHNLVTGQLPDSESFDLILCRNVLIYFARETTESVVRKIFKNCKRGGFLLIGHSESLQWTDCPWTVVQPSVFSKPNIRSSHR